MAVSNLVKEIFGWTGTGVSTLFYLAPFFPFKEVIEGKRLWSDAPGVTLCMSYLSCILWKVYGFQDRTLQVYVANLEGELLTLIWVIIYLIFFMKRNFFKSLGICILYIAVATGLDFLFYRVFSQEVVGWTANVFNVLMYAAPGEKIIRIIKTKNFKLLPIWSSSASIISTTCWMSFGILKKDIKLIVPNALGLFFAILQCTVYIIYYKITGGVVPGEEKKDEAETENEKLVRDSISNSEEKKP